MAPGFNAADTAEVKTDESAFSPVPSTVPKGPVETSARNEPAATSLESPRDAKAPAGIRREESVAAIPLPRSQRFVARKKVASPPPRKKTVAKKMAEKKAPVKTATRVTQTAAQKKAPRRGIRLKLDVDSDQGPNFD